MSQDSPFAMTERLEADGSILDGRYYKWDDGSDHDEVSKIYMIGSATGIDLIKIDYIKTGQRQDGSFHGYPSQGFPQMFEINHQQNEHLESVEVYYTKGTICALQFKTNLRISELLGYTDDDGNFTLAARGKKIIGFHGAGKNNLITLGAYVTPIIPTKMEAKGGKKGMEWDDGADHEGVTKIQVRTGLQGIQHINFDYVDKDGHPEEGKVHGSSSPGGYTLEPFEINHFDKEYLLSVDGYYDESGVIQALQFKTNIKTSEPIEYDGEGTKFTLGCIGMEIIGFHGYAETNLNSLGAYFKTLPLTKLERKGGRDNRGGYLWDDGTFQGVRKVSVYSYGEFVRCIQFEYDNNGKVESRQHGSKVEYDVREEEFVVDYPNEYLTSVEGTYCDGDGDDRGALILSLTFKTSKGRTSPKFGNEFDIDVSKFVLESSKGCALVGFHGRVDIAVLRSLGAYSFPMPPLHDAEKLDAQGSD